MLSIRDRIGTDHILASSLWATGNHDARVLATLVADAAQVDDAIIAAWSAEAGTL
ncbi:MAG: hypothetical protein IPK83_08835 [Planctomycetes bacterium]|nr:hypothetical protein [Planctomycetota bacterium]